MFWEWGGEGGRRNGARGGIQGEEKRRWGEGDREAGSLGVGCGVTKLGLVIIKKKYQSGSSFKAVVV